MAQPAGRPMVAEASARRAECAAAAAAMKFFGPKRTVEPSQLISNLFHRGESLDMWVYPSENEKYKDFGDEYARVWHEFGNRVVLDPSL